MLVKIVQIAIILAVMYWAAVQPEHPANGNNFAVVLLGAAVAFIVTVVPWLIFMGFRDIYLWLRYGPAPKEPADPDRITIGDIVRWTRAGMPLKPTRIDPVFPELPDNGFPRLGPTRDRFPRIDK